MAMVNHLIEQLRSLLGAIMTVLDRRWHQWKAAHDIKSGIEALDQFERVRMAREAGLSLRELRELSLIPYFSEDLLSLAMSSMQIDVLSFRLRYGTWYSDMERMCVICKVRRRCRRDVASDAFGLNYYYYCPNADSISEIVGGNLPINMQMVD